MDISEHAQDIVDIVDINRQSVDRECTALLSRLDVAIVLDFLAPVIVPLIGAVVMASLLFFKLSLRMGRDLRRPRRAYALHLLMRFLNAGLLKRGRPDADAEQGHDCCG